MLIIIILKESNDVSDLVCHETKKRKVLNDIFALPKLWIYLIQKKFQQKIIKWIKVISSWINRLVGCFIRLLCARKKTFFLSFITIVNGVVNLYGWPLSGNHICDLFVQFAVLNFVDRTKVEANTITSCQKLFCANIVIKIISKELYAFGMCEFLISVSIKFFIHFNGRHHIEIDFLINTFGILFFHICIKTKGNEKT